MAQNPCSTPGACKFIISVTQDNQIADGIHYDKVVIQVIDNSTGLPPTSIVGFTMQLGGQSASVPGSTDASGIATFLVYNTEVGLLDLKFYVNDGINPPLWVNSTVVKVNFVAGPPSVTNPETKLVVDKGTATADGVDKNTIHAHLVDNLGHIIANTSVTLVFSIIPSGAADANAVLTVLGSGKTDANGDIYLDIRDITAGTVLFGATVNGQTITNGSPAPVEFVAGEPDVTNPQTMLVVDQPQAPADGVTTTQIHAHLVDKFGNIIKNRQVQLDFAIIPSGGPEATAVLNGGGTVTTDASGNVYLTITNTKTGTVQLGAKVNGNTITYGSPAPVKFVSGPPDLTNPETKLVVDVPVATANGTAMTQIHAHLVDKNGNLVNIPVDISFFVIPSGSADATAVLTGGGNGLVPVNGDIVLTITNTKVGTVQLGANVNGQPITFGSPAPVKFVDNVPDASNPETKLVVQTPQATADGVAYTEIYAHLVDGAGTVVANKNVVIEFYIIPSGPADATAVLSRVGITTATTDALGNIHLTITDTKVGKVNLGARFSINSGPAITITNGSPAQVEFVAGPAVPVVPPANGTGTMLTIVHDFAPADGSSTDQVQAFITDKFGNPVKNEAVTFAIRAGGTSTATAQLVGTVTVTTDANGIAVMNITNTVPGTVWIDATIDYNGNPLSLIDGSYKEITFTNFPDLNNSETRLIVIVYEALADGQSMTTVKAHVVDATGTPLPGWDVTFRITSGTASFVGGDSVVTTDANGDAIINLTSTKPGDVLVTAHLKTGDIKFGSPAKVKFAVINIYVPPVFTPNGDGTNDVLKPILVGISSFHYMNVYNRWGNLVFTTQDPNFGWDGRFKGVPQPVETYLWIAEGVDVNGKKIVAKGMTSLVK